MVESKPDLSIPSWQHSHSSSDQKSSIEQHQTSSPATDLSHAQLLDQAKVFLQHESIRDAPRDRKVDFLRTKGLQSSVIDELLDEDAPAPSEDKHRSEELKTIHDSNQEDIQTQVKAPKGGKEQDDSLASPSSSTKTESSSSSPQSQPQPQPQSPAPRRSDPPPPIITYPEFLLKPQKPPPLITISRLVNAVYAFAGVATLTYSASKYIIEPMLDNLTAARHELADVTITDLEKLNEKLESSVSHVPYIASLATAARHKASRGHGDDEEKDDDDNESLISDPTELFHRDIATQTTPNLSRAHSESRLVTGSGSSTTKSASTTHLDATTTQFQRLTTLFTSLDALRNSLDPPQRSTVEPEKEKEQSTTSLPLSYNSFLNEQHRQPPTKRLHDTLAEFQAVLAKLETNYNPLRGDYYYSNNSNNVNINSHGGSGSSNRLAKDSVGGGTGSAATAGSNVDMVAKVRTEIRNLKGAFLSSRNFPTAPRPAAATPTTMNPYGSLR